MVTPSTPLKAIRAWCIECSGGDRSVARACIVTRCPLHKYRMGFNPDNLDPGSNKHARWLEAEQAVQSALESDSSTATPNPPRRPA